MFLEFTHYPKATPPPKRMRMSFSSADKKPAPFESIASSYLILSSACCVVSCRGECTHLTP